MEIDNSSNRGGGSNGSERTPLKTSLDEELAQATSNLSVGPSPITKLSASFLMPPQNKLYPNLYNNTFSDISMNDHATNTNQKTEQTNKGVPGFPDFPDIWMGESSSKSKRNRKPPNKIRRNKRIVRKAVNTPIIGSCSVVSKVSISKTLKLKARAERKLRRLEQCIKLKEKRRRKKSMGVLCRGMAALCK